MSEDPLNEGAVAMVETSPQPSEQHENVGLLTIAPLIWATHFLASYVTAAIYCEKWATADGTAEPVRWAILAYTLLALPMIAAVGWYGYHRHSLNRAALPHDYDSGGDRYRFLGFATLLLSVLSAVATIFTALVAVFAGSCH